MTRITRSLLLLVLVLLCTCAPGSAALRAGAGVASIAPWDLNRTWLGGFGEPRQAQGIHDDIQARAMALSDGQTTLLLVAVDLTAYNSWRINPLREELARTEGLSTEQIMIAATHTHAAPDCMGVWGPNQFTSGRWDPYTDFVGEQVLVAARQALANLEPVRLRVGVGYASTHLVDKRGPELFDEEVVTLSATGEDGNAVVTLVNFASHPEVLFNANRLVTADYPYYLREYIEAAAGGTCVFTVGNLGGLLAPLTADYSWAECARYGMEIGEIALSSLEDQPYHEHLRLDAAGKRVLIPVTNPLYIMMGTIGLLEIDWPWFEANGGGVPVDVLRWRVGDQAAFCSVPGELFTETGWDLKGQMNAPARFCINLGNEEIGYLLPALDYHYPADPFNPGANYEETLSPGIEAVPVLAEAWYELFGAPSPTPILTLTPPPTATPTQTPTATATPSPTATLSPIPTNTPILPGESRLWLQAGYAQEVLTLDVRVTWAAAAPLDAWSLYVAVEVGGGFYFMPSFTAEAVPLVSFVLPGQWDSGLVRLGEWGIPRPESALLVTWYAAFLDGSGALAPTGLASSPVRLE